MRGKLGGEGKHGLKGGLMRKGEEIASTTWKKKKKRGKGSDVPCPCKGINTEEKSTEFLQR